MTKKQNLRDNSYAIQTKGAKMAINIFSQTLEPLDVCSGSASKKLRKVTQDIFQATKKSIFVLPNLKFKEFVMLKILSNHAIFSLVL
jgi:hypothetical protein